MADASDSKSDGGNFVRVQVPPPAPQKKTPSVVLPVEFLHVFSQTFFFLAAAPEKSGDKKLTEKRKMREICLRRNCVETVKNKK